MHDFFASIGGFVLWVAVWLVVLIIAGAVTLGWCYGLLYARSLMGPDTQELMSTVMLGWPVIFIGTVAFLGFPVFVWARDL